MPQEPKHQLIGLDLVTDSPTFGTAVLTVTRREELAPALAQRDKVIKIDASLLHDRKTQRTEGKLTLTPSGSGTKTSHPGSGPVIHE